MNSLPLCGWESVWKCRETAPWSRQLCIDKRWIFQWVNVKMQQMHRKMTAYRGWVNRCSLHTCTSYLHSFFSSLLLLLMNKQKSSRYLTLEWSCSFKLGALCPLWRSAGCRQEEWKMEQLSFTCLATHKGADLASLLSWSPPPVWVLTVWRWSSKLL